MVGKTLGHYEILEPLGAGGMGEVYRAHDTTLKRDVAIKVLPEDLSADMERLARLEREAQLLAALNHPNIEVIHGLEESDDVRFMVLELIEGESLAEKLSRGRIEVEKALGIARQIAEALEAAHAKGIIHRDLKPGNIVITPEGQAKVLDFGLAKSDETEGAGMEVSPDITESPTVAAATMAGVILGTAAYMSPEQARGKPLDKRTDIWSFGCVLYEMLTSNRPFDGETVTDVLAAIVEREPDWGALPNDVPSLIRLLLCHCLEKDPHRRLHDIADARIEIDDALSGHGKDTAESTSADQEHRWQRGILLPGSLVLLAAAIGTFAWRLPTTEPVLVDRLEISLPAGDQLRSFSISPNGRTLIYSATRSGEHQLFQRPLDLLDAEPIPGTEGGDSPLVWPGDDWVSFATRSPHALYKFRLSGGPVIHLTDLPNWVRGTAWESSGHVIMGTHEASIGLLRVPTAGGEIEALTDSEEGPSQPHRFPETLPHGRGIIFTIGGSTSGDQVVLLESGASDWRQLTEGSYARYVPTGHLVFWREGNLWAVPFDLDHLEPTGEAMPVVLGVEKEAMFAWSTDGSLFYHPIEAPPSRMLVWVDRHGDEDPLSEITGAYEEPVLSPDGKTLLVRIDGKFWLLDIERDLSERLTQNDAGEWMATWSPDGKNIAFTSRLTGPFSVYQVPFSGTRVPRPLGLVTGLVFSWTDDGLLYKTDGKVQLWRFSEQRGDLLFEENATAADVSVGGEYVAYVTTEAGERVSLAIRRTSDADANRWRVTSDEKMIGLTSWSTTRTVAWSPDGRELFYRSGPAMMVVDVEETPSGLRFGAPEELFRGPYEPYFDVAPDGRFVMVRDVTQANSQAPDRIIVVRNWFEELKRLVPTGQ